jgi:SNF2 family DNA or RNA helicase
MDPGAERGLSKSFAVGDIVALRVDPGRRGPIIGLEASLGGRARYRVWHSDDAVRVYDEDQLIAVATTDSEVADPSEVFGGPSLELDEFRARFTAARLAHPAIDNLYALHAARIQYIPFQFKPLLRLLRSDRPRLLIADDVGVGKTIEAGLILRELETRSNVANVLVVCPKALTTKWRAEMRRFDEEFQILTPESLRYCLDETHLDGVWPPQYARAIVNYELFRLDDYLHGTEGRKPKPGLTQLDPPPAFDLVVVDEAHHFRNPAANSHQLAEALCDAAEAVVFLTATPVQLGSENLFELLHLLRPDLFPSIGIFREMAEPNRHLTRAVSHLGSRHDRQRSPVRCGPTHARGYAVGRRPRSAAA